MLNINFDSNYDYAAEVEMWCQKFTDLMKTEMYAAITILAYMRPGQNTMVGCPLGDPEYQMLGEAMRTNSAMFAAGVLRNRYHDTGQQTDRWSGQRRPWDTV